MATVTFEYPSELLTALGKRPDSERYNLSPGLIDSKWIITMPDPPEMSLRKELGAGETAAITLAFKRQADLIILDDLQARLVATGIGLNITGTLGILVAAHHSGFIPDLKDSIRKLQEVGFRISQQLIERLK